MVRIVPLIISALLLGAHFMRDGALELAISSVFFPVILFWRHPKALLAAQLYMAFAIIVWTLTTIDIAMVRLEHGQVWIRMAIIMGGIIGFNALALTLLRSAKVREKYVTVKAPTGDNSDSN